MSESPTTPHASVASSSVALRCRSSRLSSSISRLASAGAPDLDSTLHSIVLRKRT